jgi:hypothetical protein
MAKTRKVKRKTTTITPGDKAEVLRLVNEGLTHLRRKPKKPSKVELAEVMRWKEEGVRYLRKHDITSPELAVLAIEVGTVIERQAAQ